MMSKEDIYIFISLISFVTLLGITCAVVVKVLL